MKMSDTPPSLQIVEDSDVLIAMIGKPTDLTLSFCLVAPGH